MAIRQPRYTKEAFARRGDELYANQIRAKVEEGNEGKIVAIDIESGACKLADNTMTATKQLYKQCPDAQP